MSKLLKRLFRTQLKTDANNSLDDKDLTLTSSVSLLQKQPREPASDHHSSTKQPSVEKQISTKNQQSPGNSNTTTSTKHNDKAQRRRSILNVKPFEKRAMQPNESNQQLLQLQPPTRNNDNKHGSSNKQHHDAMGVRRIRRPPQWMGNYEKAKAQETSNNYQKTQAKDPSHADNNDDNYVEHEHAADNGGVGGVGDEEDGNQQRRFACKSRLWPKTKSFFIEFLQNSSIHGFVYLAKIGLHFFERTLWFGCICLAVFGIISLSQRTWHRFQTSPMVISMDRNKLVWNTSFPSLTVCPHKRIDELKVEEYILSHQEFFVEDEDKESFKHFMEKLASLSYQNIDELPTNKTYGINSAKYLDLLYELKWQFEPEISSGAAVKMFIYETQTEFGICHSVNSLVARYNSYDYWKRNEWNPLYHGKRVTVHPLDGEIYAQIINLSTAYDVYFHSANDIPSITKQRYTFPETDYTTVELIALEITTAEAGRAFSTKQRKCRFIHESEHLLTSSIYSFGICMAECRMFLALRICKCVPHFYRNRLRNGRVLPICDLDGLACVGQLKSEMISMKSNRLNFDCNCLANCDDSNFFVQSYRSRVWFLGANLQWGIIDYPKMQLRRDVLFSFADVLVYIGGLVGFFLGCSALSFTEVIYNLTITFVRRLFCRHHSRN